LCSFIITYIYHDGSNDDGGDGDDDGGDGDGGGGGGGGGDDGNGHDDDDDDGGDDDDDDDDDDGGDDDDDDDDGGDDDDDARAPRRTSAELSFGSICTKVSTASRRCDVWESSCDSGTYLYDMSSPVASGLLPEKSTRHIRSGPVE